MPVLRLAFWSLVALNAVLFAYAQGVLGTSRASDHEPARLKRQFNTAKMTLLTRAQAEAAAQAAPAPGTDAAIAAVPAAPAPAPAAPVPAAAAAAPTAPAAPSAAEFACTEIGPFDSNDARRFEARLAALALGERQSRQAVQAQDVTSWLVNIPPQGSKEAADRKAAELRNLGITDFFIMNGDSPLRYAISLGAFKTESGAQTLLAQLGKQGVHSARITPRGPQTTHYVYRVRALDAATRKRIAGYAERYDGGALRNCG
jgi:hypothetical protein